MNQEVGKNMTVDDLARLMQGEFLGVNKRFDGVDKRFDGVDKRFDGVDKRFDGIENRLVGHDMRFDGIENRLVGHDMRFDGIENRLTILEADVKFIKNNASELFTKLDEFISLYRDTQQELVLIAKQMRRLEERVTQLEGKPR